MKLLYPEVKADFIVDSKGNKKKVILDIKQFNKLMEALEDYHDIAAVALEKEKKQDFFDWEDVKKEISKKKNYE